MALIHRMSRLLTADVHAVLDRLEEPDVLLKHALREMEEEITEAEQALEQLEREHDAARARQRRVDAARSELEGQLVIALDAGNEQLARRLMRRKLEAEKLEKHMDGQAAATLAAIDNRRRTLAEQRERLDVLRQKAEIFAPRPPAESPCGEHFERERELVVSDDEVEIALMRARQGSAAS